MVFNETTNYDFSLPRKQVRFQLIFSRGWCLILHRKLNMFLKFLGGQMPGSLLVAGSASKACQRQLETRAGNFWDLVQATNKTLLVFANLFTVNAHHTQNTNWTSRHGCWHDYGKLTWTRTPRRLHKIEQMNYENSPQQMQLCTQYSLRSQD